MATNYTNYTNFRTRPVSEGDNWKRLVAGCVDVIDVAFLILFPFALPPTTNLSSPESRRHRRTSGGQQRHRDSRRKHPSRHTGSRASPGNTNRLGWHICFLESSSRIFPAR